MSGHVLPLTGSDSPWAGGDVSPMATCVLAPNASPLTLDGTNTWVVGAAEEPVVVIDPGPSSAAHRAKILEAVGERRVSAIVLTHGHLDHSEGARALAEVVRAPIQAVDPTLRHGGEGLAPGSVLDVAGGCEVVLTPGHSADSACLVLREDRSLLAGDTILGRGTALIAWPDGNLAHYLDSLARLLDHVDGIDRLLPGHGPALTHPADVIATYLEHRRARLAEVRSIVDSGVVEPSEIVAIAYADVPREIWPAAELTVRAQLEYLAQVHMPDGRREDVARVLP